MLAEHPVRSAAHQPRITADSGQARQAPMGPGTPPLVVEDLLDPLSYSTALAAHILGLMEPMGPENLHNQGFSTNPQFLSQSHTSRLHRRPLPAHHQTLPTYQS